ncbi:MAG: RluA family pseudouridine synthase [Bradymonadales bacterium]|nr:RluA family pseudouridine synthase [Bradymonadales bacterium]
MNYTLVVDEDSSRQRFDSFLAQMTGLSRCQVQRLIREGAAQLDGSVETRCSPRLRVGQRVGVEIGEPRPTTLIPSPLPLEVVFEDDHILVLNKVAGMVVHPSPGHSQDTLVNVLVHRITDLSGIGGKLRPGIVHRLDRDTSGLMVVAKHDAAHQGLAEQFAQGTISKLYVALVAQLRGPGLFEREGIIDTAYGRDPRDRKRFSSMVDQGRRAVTRYRITDRFSQGAMRVECRPVTGRTHQIRVHLADRGCPVIGDTVYGGRAMQSNRLIDRQALHAHLLGFVHPVTGETLQFEGEVPDDFRRAEEILRGGGEWR